MTEQAKKAVESVSSLLSRQTIPCLINGEVHETANTFDLFDPHDQSKLLHKVSAAGEDDAASAIKAAQAALPKWSNASPVTRRAVLRRVIDILDERQKDIAEIVARETTGNDAWGVFEIGLVKAQTEEISSCIAALRGEIIMSDVRTYKEYCPYGVVFSIAPWNAPLILGARALSNPLAGGNTVVLKSSEYSPKTHLALVRAFQDALEEHGFTGVVNLIHVATKDAGKVVHRIISDRAVRKVNFTGSTRVGRIIAETSARYLKPCTLELGGKAPMIVMPSANLDRAAGAATFSAFANSGQVCMATNTVFVHKSIIEPFKEKLTKITQNIKAGPESSSALRGLFTPAAAERIDIIIKDALQKGAKIFGGEHKVEGSLVQPVIFQDIKPGMTLWNEENFGPILSVVPFETEEEAIELANETEYGLAAAVWSSNESEGLRIAKQIGAGQVHVNGPTVSDHSAAPHGGWGSSGIGKFNSIEGIKEFLQIRVIDVRPSEQPPYPFEG